MKRATFEVSHVPTILSTADSIISFRISEAPIISPFDSTLMIIKTKSTTIISERLMSGRSLIGGNSIMIRFIRLFGIRSISDGERMTSQSKGCDVVLSFVMRISSRGVHGGGRTEERISSKYIFFILSSSYSFIFRSITSKNILDSRRHPFSQLDIHLLPLFLKKNK